MTEIIEIKEQKNGTKAVSARELHKVLEIKKKFNAWISILDNFDESQDFVREPKGYFTKSGNRGTVRYYDDYILTMDTAKEICMLSKTEKGRTIRRYFIEVEKKWHDPKAMAKRLGVLTGEQKMARNKLTVQLIKERNKRAALMLKTCDYLPADKRQLVAAEVATMLMGKPVTLATPTYYTATDVATKRDGLTALEVGRLANRIGIKPDGEANEYGKFYHFNGTSTFQYTALGRKQILAAWDAERKDD